jgi:transposase-like protein
MGYTGPMHTCPNCQSSHFQVKDGFTRAGSQRIRCQACGRRYTPDRKHHGYPPELRARALPMYVDGLNFRRIGRLLGIDHQTVSNWVTAAADQLPATPPAPATSATVELDELHTFVGAKKTRSTS